MYTTANNSYKFPVAHSIQWKTWFFVSYKQCAYKKQTHCTFDAIPLPQHFL